MELQCDKYFDITCRICAFSRSTDFEFGFETNLKRLRRYAKKEGWKVISIDGKDLTVCPLCVQKYISA